MSLFPEELTNVFEVKDHLNFGGYGTIYRVIKRSNLYSGNQKIYAMKAVIRAIKGSSWKDIETEIQVLSWANPYKLRLDSFFVSGNTFFMVIDYCGNGDLLTAIADKIHIHELFKEDEIWKYFIQICFGLESLHYNGFIHRDLHPQNILLDENKDIKIADFGISRSLPTKTIQGVSAYQSPRSHSGGTQAKESDVWAVGCILYYLCNLEHPFGDNVNKIKYDPHVPIRSEYSDELRDFIDRCLKKKRAERPTILNILAHEFIVNKTLSLGIKIPQTSTMNATICQIQLKNEREKNERLEKELFEYRKENMVQKNEIEWLRAEIARLNGIINENKKSCKNIEKLKEEINSKMENEMDQINSQIIDINKDFKKINKLINPQNLLQELRDNRLDILNKPNDPELEKEFRKNCSVYQSHTCINDPPIQQAYQDYNRTYRQKTSLYSIQKVNNKTNLLIYDTERESREVRVLETPETLDFGTCIALLPFDNLFCFGNRDISGICLIIDENYKIQHLPSGTPCWSSSSIYLNNSVYCFGGCSKNALTLSERFDLYEKQWIKLKPLPQADFGCMNIIFNENILISGKNNKNLLRYSIVSNTFVTIPYDFANGKRKILINSERLYLIECWNGSIYESEVSNDSVWRRIGDSIIRDNFNQIYVIYNKGAINIAHCCGGDIKYFKFNLKEKTLEQLV